MDKIKVLHYAPGFKEGGIESRMVDWYEKINREKYQFVLLKCNSDNKSSKLIRLKQLGCKVYNNPPFSIKTVIPFVLGIKKVLLREKPDVVHVHNPFTGYFVLKEAKKAGVPIRILHSRTTDFLPNEKNVPIKKALRLLSPKYATHYFACSIEAGLWGIGKKYKRKIKVINNGINIDNFKYSKTIRDEIRKKYNISSDTFVVGTIGRLSPQKNLTKLVEVFYEINKCNNNSLLFIVGEGSDKKKLVKKLESMNLLSKTILAGSKSDVYNYYMAFDCFVSTSHYEGFGTTAIEAQATGLPTFLSLAFPKTVMITNYITRIPLCESNSKWAKTILDYKHRFRTEYDTIAIDQAGFSSDSIAKELEEYYSGRKKA